MKKLLITLPLSLLLFSTAQAQQEQAEQSIVNGMFNQIAGQLYNEGEVDLKENSFLNEETLYGKNSEIKGYEGDRLTHSFEGNTITKTKRMTRPILKD